MRASICLSPFPLRSPLSCIFIDAPTMDCNDAFLRVFVVQRARFMRAQPTKKQDLNPALKVPTKCSFLRGWCLAEEVRARRKCGQATERMRITRSKRVEFRNSSPIDSSNLRLLLAPILFKEMTAAVNLV
jgi:hypothetical protein